MNLDNLKTNFVSDVDKLLTEVHHKQSDKSASIQQEVRQSQRVAKLRDDATARRAQPDVWQDF